MRRRVAAAEGANDERGFLEIKTSRREIKRGRDAAGCLFRRLLDSDGTLLAFTGPSGGRRAKTGAAVQEFLISLCRTLGFLFLKKTNQIFLNSVLPCGHSKVCLSFSLFLSHFSLLFSVFLSYTIQANQETRPCNWPRCPTLHRDIFKGEPSLLILSQKKKNKDRFFSPQAGKDFHAAPVP